jgi:hypothetical protein
MPRLALPPATVARSMVSSSISSRETLSVGVLRLRRLASAWWIQTRTLIAVPASRRHCNMDTGEILGSLQRSVELVHCGEDVVHERRDKSWAHNTVTTPSPRQVCEMCVDEVEFNIKALGR